MGIPSIHSAGGKIHFGSSPLPYHMHDCPVLPFTILLFFYLLCRFSITLGLYVPQEILSSSRSFGCRYTALGTRALRTTAHFIALCIICN